MKRMLLLAMALLIPLGSASALEAGAAKVDITAPIGTPLNGYGDRMGRDSEGIHDPIWSRALYLDDGQTRLFLVSVDLVAVNPELRERVVALTSDIIPPENVILTATHTHSGQGAMVRNIAVRFVSGRFMPEVLEATATGIAQSMRNAYEKRRRAALGYAAGAHQGLSANRRYPKGPTDEQLGVIVVEDADGNPISVATNFAAHPTSVGGKDQYVFSADFPGYYYLEMEELMGPECVALFLNGAQGNQTISDPEGHSGWERTESVGRLLARRAKKIAETITFGETELRLSHLRAVLPRTLGTMLQPEEVLLHSLEINGLLLSFFPGEPCVELGLELRRRALARGYEAHFSVGLSNDYIMYFTPRHLYPDLNYESSMSFFGPGMEDWFYKQFESLMKLPAPDSEEASVESDAPEPQSLEGGLILDLAGDAFAIGAARGNAFVADIQERYETRVVAQVESRRWLPDSGLWPHFPPFLDIAALALPRLGMGSRSLLKGLSMDLIREMEGMAEGARLPFDALWLLQHAPLYEEIGDKSLLFAAPLCTMFAAVGERAGADDLIVGRNLDWPLPEHGVVTRVRPDEGLAFLQVGFSWNVGVFTAMNEAGVTLAVERVNVDAPPFPSERTVEFVLRDIIQSADSFATALEALEQATHLRGVHVLVAGFEGPRPRAAVVEYGEKPFVRLPENGLLLGVTPDEQTASASTRARYARAAEAFAETRIIAVNDAQAVLTDRGADDSGLAAPWNEHTRHSAVFLPKKRIMRAAFPNADGQAGDYGAVTFPGEAHHE